VQIFPCGVSSNQLPIGVLWCLGVFVVKAPGGWWLAPLSESPSGDPPILHTSLSTHLSAVTMLWRGGSAECAMGSD